MPEDESPADEAAQMLDGNLQLPTTERSVKAGTSPDELQDAAKDGRVSIRPKQMSLAVVNKINEVFGDSGVVDALQECLQATKTVSVGKMPMEVPDYKTRLDTAKVIMQYQVGNPVTRQEVVTHTVDTLSSLQAKLQKSPALRRAVGNMLGGATDGNMRDANPHQDAVDVGAQSVGLTDSEAEEAQRELQSIESDSPTEMSEAIKRVTKGAVDLPSRGSGVDAIEKFST